MEHEHYMNKCYKPPQNLKTARNTRDLHDE